MQRIRPRHPTTLRTAFATLLVAASAPAACRDVAVGLACRSDDDCPALARCGDTATCVPALADEGEGEGVVVGEGEGEGIAAGEGEGEGTDVVAEGEGEGAVVVAEGEGEGTVVVAEGEGEGAVVVAEGEGEGAVVVAEGEGEGAVVVAEGEGEGVVNPPPPPAPLEIGPTTMRVLLGRDASVTITQLDGSALPADVVVQITTPPVRGTATLTGTGVNYTASATDESDVTIGVTASDSNGRIATLTLLVDVIAPASCQQVLDLGLNAGDGAYLLTSGTGATGPYALHDCQFRPASNQGWTLVVKGAGNSSAIGFNALANVTGPIALATDATTTASGTVFFPAYFSASVKEARVYFGAVVDANAVDVPLAASTPVASLDVALASSTTVANGPSRAVWEAALPGTFALQPNCQSSGVNVQIGSGNGTRRARLGIVSSQNSAPNCDGNLRTIGFGLDGADGTFAGGHQDGGGVGNEDVSYVFVYVR